MIMHNPLRRKQKPTEQQEETTAELSSTVDNTVRYARLFWSAMLFFAVVFGIIYADRYVSAYETDLVKRRDISIQMIEAIESKNIVYVPVPESVYLKITEAGK
ncbi:MAG: hypothetical protein AB7F25_06930 [Deferribacterales bacterium]